MLKLSTLDIVFSYSLAQMIYFTLIGRYSMSFIAKLKWSIIFISSQIKNIILCYDLNIRLM
jgi:hypothetical protein